MSFEFNFEEDRIIYAMFNKMTKDSTTGEFQKAGQYYNAFKKLDATTDARKESLTSLGITVAPGQKAVDVHALISWTDYGSRSKIPVIYSFIVDELGVVAKYKVGGYGNLRVGWAPSADKVVLQWERTETPNEQEWLVKEKNPPKKVVSEEEVMAKLMGGAQAGRYDITGKVVSLKSTYKEFAYNVGGYVTKALVIANNGIKYHVTVPSDMVDSISRFDEITFKATVKPSKDDPMFAFCSRPFKMVVLGHHDIDGNYTPVEGEKETT